MITSVTKRNGKTVPYDENRIYSAVSAAYTEVYGDIAHKEDEITEVVDAVADRLSDFTETMSVETVQDIVEAEIAEKDFSVARAYITYRYSRKLARNDYSLLMDTMSEKLNATNVENQNANVDECSFGGRLGSMTSAMSKYYALNYVMSKLAKDNHENNTIYTHDLDHYSVGDHNCLSIPMDDLLSKGFKVRQCDVRPANSVSTGCQLIVVIKQLQSLQNFGGVSATHLDHTLVPYVRKSFRKHYIFEYLKDSPRFDELDILNLAFDTYTDNCGIIRNKFDDWVEENKTKFYEETGLSDSDFYLDNKSKLCKKLYNSALIDTIAEIKQGIEGLYHNLNTLQSRSGNQLPFSSINYGTNTETEGRLITKVILENCTVGVGALGRTSIFPCGIFQYSKNINMSPDSPNYDLYEIACQSTAKRLYPNYCNTDWSVDIKGRMLDVEHKRKVIESLSENKKAKLVEWVKQNPSEARKYKLVFADNSLKVDELIVHPTEISSTMGCRTYNGYDINFDFNYIVDTICDTGKPPSNYFYSGNQKDGRGNICPVTIILPTIAMMAEGDVYNKDIDSFMGILEQKIDEAWIQLKERFDWICSQPMESARFMYENNTMLGYDGKEIRSALKHGTLALGQLGLAECLQILVGCDHTTELGMETAKKIEQMFKDKCAYFKETEHLNVGVYFTPAENLCFTAMTKFKQKYGEIPRVSENKFFTNSIHVPVWHTCSMKEKIDIEAELTGYSSAGCITYIENDGYAVNNPKALQKIIDYAMQKDVPYFAINVPNDACNDCGFMDKIDDVCPCCGSYNISRLRRVTGYLNGDYKTTFNEGKQQEVEMRVKHK